MVTLKRIGNGKYRIIKIAMGVQARGKQRPKIMHEVFMIKHYTQTYGKKVYDYGIINMGDIRTKPYLIGKKVKIILEVIKK